MKLNDLQGDFQHHQKSESLKTKIIPFEKKAGKIHRESKHFDGAKIITFPKKYGKVYRLKNYRFFAGTIFGSCGGFFWIIFFILILALLFVI